jgi:putative ABC transport system permease protein
VLLVTAGTVLTTANAAGYRRLVMLAFGRGRAGLASRLGLAYPLARPVRTGLLLGVFALVTFTLTFTAVITGILSEQAPVLTRATSAGADLLVDSHPLTPVSEEDLTAVEGVAGTATLVRGFVSVEHPALGADARFSLAAGIDDALLDEGVPALTDRDPAFPDDAAAWQAVLRDPTLAVVSDLALQDTGDLPESPLAVGDRFRLVDPATDRTLDLTVAGVATADVQLNGVMLQRGVLEGLLAPQAVANRHYVTVDPGADPGRVAGRLEGELYASGVSARTFEGVVDEALSKQRGFFRLMQGFLALGLVVGVAGLAVVMVRAVRERRRQIGMLRAIGYEPRTVRSYFLVEALFVSIRGVLLGCVLGLVVSWSLLLHAGVTDRAGLRFVVPWGALVLVIGAPLVCSLVAAALPAARAARISPSAALRVAD